MIESMTGFSSNSFEISFYDADVEKKVDLLIELKCLNSRYFEASFKIPSSLYHLELQLNTLFKKHLISGRLFCTIKPARPDMLLESYRPVHAVIKAYVNFSEELTQTYSLKNDLAVSQILSAPGVFVPSALEMTEEQETSFLLIMKKMVDQLKVVRQQEGKTLAADLQNRLVVCRARLAFVTEYFKKYFEVKREELNAQRELCLDPEKILQDPSLKLRLDELYSLIHKGDIHEELVRFNAHLVAFESLIETSLDDEKGRRFDFILQEMNREVNTMSAKLNFSDVSKAIIDIKCELEKMREQVQNIV
jgi:uncharacterized protein (TIGR00255 family)